MRGKGLGVEGLFRRRLILSIDLLCVLGLILLWLLYFWRLITPNTANQISLKEGDFSGQFVAYAGYQVARLAHGQIPLWNPFSNGGTPFLADTQSAALYLPRLIVLTITNLFSGNAPTPGMIYNALQLEMAAHVLFASLTMYAFMRRLTGITPTESQSRSVGTYAAGLIGGLTFAYGGYLTGYPPLQLAVLETAVWLPTILIGLHCAIQPESARIRWSGVISAGMALALALLAGHPQTDLALIYLTSAYLIFRIWQAKRHWTVGLRALIIFGGIGVGLAAVQLIPGLEFSRLSARSADFTFDSQGGGFPLSDVVQMIFPGFITLWSPLYFGITGLALALWALWTRSREVIFWFAAGVIALGLSFGAHTILYDIVYNVLPGFSLFRGQERTAFVVAAASAILAGLGTWEIIGQTHRFATTESGSRSGGPMCPPGIRYMNLLIGGAATITVITAIVFVHGLFNPTDSTIRLNLMTISTLLGWLTIALIRWRSRLQPIALIALVIFDLFTFGRSTSNYDPQPAVSRLPASPLIQQIQADQNGLYRVDGTRGLMENYGSLYSVPDITGISPLRFEPYDRLLKLPIQRAWELLAVRYVLTDNTQLPIPSRIVGQGADSFGAINLHQINDPRPFALLTVRTWIAPTEDSQRSALADPNIPLRQTVILAADPGITLPDRLPADSTATVQDYTPESFTVKTYSSTAALLSLAQVDYPGWQATIDGQPIPILRANLALMAIPLPEGDHTIHLVFQPISVTIGLIVSFWVLLFLMLGSLFLWLGSLTGRKRKIYSSLSTVSGRW